MLRCSFARVMSSVGSVGVGSAPRRAACPHSQTGYHPDMILGLRFGPLRSITSASSPGAMMKRFTTVLLLVSSLLFGRDAAGQTTVSEMFQTTEQLLLAAYPDLRGRDVQLQFATSLLPLDRPNFDIRELVAKVF